LNAIIDDDDQTITLSDQNGNNRITIEVQAGLTPNFALIFTILIQIVKYYTIDWRAEKKIC